jgi:predicted small secreted protein
MRRPTAIRAAVALAAVLTLSACNEIDQAQQGVNKAQECATLASKLTGIDLNPRTAPAEVEAKAKEVEDTVNGLTSEDVKSAGNALVDKLGELTTALRKADAAEINQAIDDVQASARNLATTCNIPVDQILGQ